MGADAAARPSMLIAPVGALPERAGTAGAVPAALRVGAVECVLDWGIADWG